jgi:hypothetical protein
MTITRLLDTITLRLSDMLGTQIKASADKAEAFLFQS